MKEDNIQIYPDFEDIKRTFDPAFKYIVIEGRGESEDDPHFSMANAALSSLKENVLSRQICLDRVTGRRMLIAKIDHRETEEIMLGLLETNLKKDFNCYVY